MSDEAKRHYCGCCLNRRCCDVTTGGWPGPFHDACDEHDCDGMPVVDDDDDDQDEDGGSCGSNGSD